MPPGLFLQFKVLGCMRFPAFGSFGQATLSLEFVIRGWEATALNVLAVAVDGVGDNLLQIGIFPDELWHISGREPQEIAADENLAVALWPGANADCRNPQRLCDLSRHCRRDTLQHD